MDSGTLYLVATPIGNLGDFSLRAADTLRESDLILAEDTRSYLKLAQHFDIQTKAQSFFEHNEKAKLQGIIGQLEAGKTISLLAEAGTPTLSDPGYRLVAACREAGIPVSTVPGPCAAITALSISGFETDSFYFGGFLSQKKGKRRQTFVKAFERNCTSIFYESPHRIISSLEILVELDPSRMIFIGRELTKFHEESLRDTAAKLLAELRSREQIKGEITLVIKKTGRPSKTHLLDNAPLR